MAWSVALVLPASGNRPPDDTNSKRFSIIREKKTLQLIARQTPTTTVYKCHYFPLYFLLCNLQKTTARQNDSAVNAWSVVMSV